MKKFMLSFIFVFMSLSAFSQIEVKYFNAEWNKANGIEWVEGLSDCEVKSYDIGVKPEMASKYKVVVIPTILIFQDGEEVERFQADISFKMEATKEEVQDKVDELVMSAF